MQYLLTEGEFLNFKDQEEKMKNIRKIIKKNYDSENKRYNFDEESFKMLFSVLGGCGSAFIANVCGTEFVICKNHAESCDISDKIRQL